MKDWQKAAIAGVILVSAMSCCGVGGALGTWATMGSGGTGSSAGSSGSSGSGGSASQSGGQGDGVVAITQPVSNPPTKTPPIRPGTISAPEWVPAAFGAEACDTLTDGGPLHGSDCVTADIACNEQIIGHTHGGVDLYDTKFWEKKYCWPATLDHDAGNERVYRLKMPAGEWRAWVTLHTPCADLDVFGARWDDMSCPTMGSNINVCEAKPEKSTRSERIELTSQTFDGREPIWYIVVEGKEDQNGPFSLHVQCSPGLGGPVRPMPQ